MALELTPVLAPHPVALVVAVAIDLALGDPVYRGHPVRLMGRTLQGVERALRRIGADAYGGGIVLFMFLAGAWVGGLSWGLRGLSLLAPWAGWGLHLFLLYSLLALGDLLHHGWRIERALRHCDLAAARTAVSQLVGRDTDRMDAGACRRAAIESLSENLTDGFTSPLFWYVVAGMPGLVLFKVVSTMDSMVGYKTPLYFKFGWCGARLDDAMNFVPARLTFVLLAFAAAALPGYSASGAIRVGWSQHALLPGPNSGWSEAATAGAIKRRLVGPIWMNGHKVTDAWLGDPKDPTLETDRDYWRASVFIAFNGVVAAFIAWLVLQPYPRLI